jgi:hypothetical protein
MIQLSKCGLLGALSAALFTVLFTSSSASAVSAYDNVYISSNGTAILTNQNYNDCPLTETDIALDWSTYITDETKWWSGYNNANMQATKASFENALATGRWGVSVFSGNVSVYWTEDATLQLNWNAPVNGSSGSIVASSSTQNMHSTVITPTCPYGGGFGANAKYSMTPMVTGNIEPTVSNGDTNTSNLFVYTDYYNYPASYEGGTISSGVTVAEIVKPSIKGSVKGLDLEIYSSPNDIIEEIPLTNYWIKYLIAEGDYGCNPATETCIPLYFLEGMAQPDQRLTARLPRTGVYYVQAQYVDVSGAQLPDTETIDFEIGERRLDVDGSFFDFDTDNEVCDVNGQCEPLTATGGNPIIGILNSLTPKTFGLQTFVTAPIEFLGTLPSVAQNCTPITMTLPFLNEPISYPCLTQTVYQPHFQTILTIYQTIMTGVVAYWVGIKIFSTIKNINSPDNDRIEVAQL